MKKKKVEKGHNSQYYGILADLTLLSSEHSQRSTFIVAVADYIMEILAVGIIEELNPESEE